MRNCPKCDAAMTHIEDEPDVNIRGGWVCDDCGVFIGDADDDGEP